MNLADWLQGDHEPSERLKAVETLCRAVSDSSRSLDLDPSHIQVSGNGECRPSEGKGVPTGRYRPPEVAQGGPPMPQSQVFTVGVLCFEILSGRAFESRGGPLLRDLRPDLPRDLSDAVQACLEMDAEWRPKDLSYLLGLVEAQAASGGSSAKPAARGGRPASVAATPVNRARRGGPAPRSGPLLVFALLALGVSIATAVVRLRQPLEPPALPPAPSVAPLPSAAAPATSAAPSPSAVATLPSGGAIPGRGPSPAPSSLPSPPVRPGAAMTAPAVARVPSPTPTVAPAPVAAAPTTTLAAATPAPARVGGPPVTEPPAPAAVTNVSPPLLRRGANVLVDVHGVGLRGDHQARITRPREAVRGVEVMRQRYVGPTVIQVLLHLDAGAPTGAYFLLLVDGAGNATNARPFEIVK
jgi:hypothetical protein